MINILSNHHHVLHAVFAHFSCDRSREAPNKDFLQLIHNSDTDLTEREAGMRESELVDGNPPLFEMMENVYMAVSICIHLIYILLSN